MKSKYVPLRREMTVVETLRFMPEDPVEIQKIHDELVKKYRKKVTIEKREFEEIEWSWRTDTQYTVHRTEYLVKCMQPVYSDADQRAMSQEAHDEAMAKFVEKYAKIFKKKK